MSDWPERTAEEREAARLERERRREQDPEGATQAYDVLGARDADEVVREGGDGWPDTDEVPRAGRDGWADDDEVPLGTRRIARADRTRRTRSDAERRRRPAARRQPVPAPRRRRGSLIARGLSLIAIALAAAAIWFAVELFQPFHGSPHGRVTVIVPARLGAKQIGDLLAAKGVVPSGFFFDLRAMLAGDRGKLLSGTYHLQFGMTYAAALKALMTPPPAAKTSPITIVPGKSRVEIDALLRQQHIKGSYLAASRHSPLLNPAQYGAPRSTRSLEGFLFPDTYQLRDPITAAALVADQLKAFRQKFATVKLRYVKSRHLTAYDALTIASIVEMEAATARDMPLVASVIYNRLHDHIPLGMDSTTRYEFNNYDKPLTQSQLASPSPYNTRLHAGLPPTPIDNPGLAAIRAAANPPRTNYLYFVAKVCGNGESVFESNYTQFLRDSARYTAARNARGGHSPTHC